MPGRSQVEILIGGSSVARSAPEYFGAFLANEVLGGRPLLSRLFQQVRLLLALLAWVLSGGLRRKGGKSTFHVRPGIFIHLPGPPPHYSAHCDCDDDYWE